MLYKVVKARHTTYSTNDYMKNNLLRSKPLNPHIRYYKRQNLMC